MLPTVTIAPAVLAPVVLFENSFQTTASQTITVTNSNTDSVDFNVRPPTAACRAAVPVPCGVGCRSNAIEHNRSLWLRHTSHSMRHIRAYCPTAVRVCWLQPSQGLRVVFLLQASAIPNGLFGGWIATTPASAPAIPKAYHRGQPALPSEVLRSVVVCAVSIMAHRRVQMQTRISGCGGQR